MEQPVDPLKKNVDPYQLIGWLSMTLKIEGPITVQEWNKAVHALAGTQK